MFWYKLHLFGDVYLSTGPEAVAEGELRRQMGRRFADGCMCVVGGGVFAAQHSATC